MIINKDKGRSILFDHKRAGGELCCACHFAGFNHDSAGKQPFLLCFIYRKKNHYKTKLEVH